MTEERIHAGSLVEETPNFELHLGILNGQQVLLKAAKTPAENSALAKEAGMFLTLKAFSERLAKRKEYSYSADARYDSLFASPLSSLMRDGLRTNTLVVSGVDAGEAFPLSKIAQMELDTRTSAWILEKLLRFYSFFELFMNEIKYLRYPIFSSDDYLICPRGHRLLYCNYSGEVADASAIDSVRVVASFILHNVVINDSPQDKEYMKALQDLSGRGRHTFKEAHHDFYLLLDDLWGIRRHPFTYREPGSSDWKVIT